MRIASLVPSATEMVAAMGLGHRLVARTHECDHPDTILGVTAVTADLLPPDLSPGEIDEAVAGSIRDAHTIYALDGDALRAASPDVVLTQATCAVCAVDTPTVEDVVCEMPHAARVVSFDPVTLDEVVEGAAVLGAAVDGVRQGLALSSHLRNRLRWTAGRVADRSRPRVAVVEWPDPVYAPGHWVPDIVEGAGGTSVFGIAGKPSVRSDIGALAATEPDAVLFAFCGYDLATTMRHADEMIATEEWAEQLGPLEPSLLAIDGSGYTSRPGPRLVDAVEALAWSLHRPHPDLRPQPGILMRRNGSGWSDEALR